MPASSCVGYKLTKIPDTVWNPLHTIRPEPTTISRSRIHRRSRRFYGAEYLHPHSSNYEPVLPVSLSYPVSDTVYLSDPPLILSIKTYLIKSFRIQNRFSTQTSALPYRTSPCRSHAGPDEYASIGTAQAADRKRKRQMLRSCGSLSG